MSPMPVSSSSSSLSMSPSTCEVYAAAANNTSSDQLMDQHAIDASVHVLHLRHSTA
jgi:hypothetical protein